jgi:hypothetical protein
MRLSLNSRKALPGAETLGAEKRVWQTMKEERIMEMRKKIKICGIGG